MSLLAWVFFVIAIIGAATCLFAALHIQKLRTNDQHAHSAALACVHADLTNAAMKLMQTNAEYDSLLTGCGSGVFVLDANDIIERASPEGCRLLGLHEKQVYGKSLLQATLSNELQTVLKQAHALSQVQRCEIRLHGMNGHCVSITIVPVQVNCNTNSRCLVIANDVTELRRLETVRRDFVANVSHELRTPLTSIRAMAETLQDGALRDTDVAEHFLETISTEVQRLTRISEDLLILSHAESHPAEVGEVALSKLLEVVVNRFQQQAENDDKTLTLSTPAELCVTGSPDQIEQVIINLIDNAIKYTSAGGSISVSVELLGDSVAVHVADTGIGIMSQDLPRIFERFYRVDKARSRQSGGTGLGLSIVKHIVESHGGAVIVESEFNRGSTFTFTVPYA